MTLTIDIKDSATDKILYFLENCKDDVTIINQNEEDFDYLSQSELEELKQISRDFKNGKRDDFEEYAI